MSKKGSSIKSNIAFNTLYNMLTIIIPLVVSPYLARVIGVEGVGVYSFTLAVANYFKRFSMLGMEKFGNRSIALVRDDGEARRRAFWSIYAIQAASGLVVFLGYVLYLVCFDQKGTASQLQALFVLSALFEVSWYFFGREAFKPALLVQTVAKLAYLVLTFVLVRDQQDVHVYITLAALSYLLPNVLLFCWAVRQERFCMPRRADVLPALKGTLVLFVSVIAVTVYKSMDKLMLGVMFETSHQNGLYENAEKILHVPIAVISAVSAVMMPRMTMLYRDKREDDAGRYLLSSVRFAAFMSMGATFGLMGIAAVFSNVYWGEAFAGCAELLRAFALCIPFMSLAEIVRTQYIIPQKQDRWYIGAVCSGLVVNLVVNLLLIPRLGAMGAVWGTVAAEAAVCGYQLFKVRRALPVGRLLLSFVQYGLVGLPMLAVLTVVCAGMANTVLNLLISLALGVMVYGACACGYMYFLDKEMWRSALAMVRRGRK